MEKVKNTLEKRKETLNKLLDTQPKMVDEYTAQISAEIIEEINQIDKALLILFGVVNWVAYDWNKPSTHPPKAGRYLIYRSKCDKIHFEQWNGSGWSSSNNDCTHYTLIKPPCY